MVEPAYNPNVWTPPARRDGRVILPERKRPVFPGAEEMADPWAMPTIINPYVHAAGGGGFNPGDYPNYTAGYDAALDCYSDTGTTLCVNNDPVRQWKNQADLATYILNSATLANRPIYHTGGPNSLPYVTGDGSDDYLQGGGSNIAQPLTVYVVLKQEAWADTMVICSDANTGGARLWQRTATPTVKMYAGTDFTTGVSATLAAWCIVSAVFSAGSSKIRLNDGSRTALSPGSSGLTSGITLFNAPNALSPASVSIAQYLLYSSAHSDADNDLVVAGLKTKFAI